MDKKNILIVCLILLVFGLLFRMLYLQSQHDSTGKQYAISEGYKTEKGSVPSGGGQATDHMEVLSELKSRLKETPNDPALIAAVGDAYFGLMQFGPAIEYYKQALAINPDDVDTLNDIGLAEHYEGRSADGLKYIETGITKNPYYQRIWLTKGFIYAYGIGNSEEAVKAWERAKTIDPESGVGKTAGKYIVEFTKQKEKLASEAGAVKSDSSGAASTQAEKSFYGGQ